MALQILSWKIFFFSICYSLFFLQCHAGSKVREVVIVAGNFSIDGKLVNIAQYDMVNEEWSTDNLFNLYLYGESNGVVWDIAVNATSDRANKLFVVGAFDTISETSQVQYCSVGGWDGTVFEKVGEGLCPRGVDSSTTMRIQTIVFGDGNDLFVGGSFESRVWDGKHFANVNHVAFFDASKNSWLPLQNGVLNCSSGAPPRVNGLAWDPIEATLYIGGYFDSIDSTIITSGLAIWTNKGGLRPFPGGGILVNINDEAEKLKTRRLDVVSDIAFEPVSQSLFVAGDFSAVGSKVCKSIAVWYRLKNEWRCLYSQEYGISTVTTMFLDAETLYLSGWAAPDSSWIGRSSMAPYPIARLNISGYIDDYRIYGGDDNTGDHWNPLPGLPDKNGTLDQDLDKNGTKAKSNLTRVYSAAAMGRLDVRVFHDPLLQVPMPSVVSGVESVGAIQRRKLFQHHIARNSVNITEERNSMTTRSRQDEAARAGSHSHRRVRGRRRRRRMLIQMDPMSPRNGSYSGLWNPEWEWLPGYSGGNGPVLNIARGDRKFNNSLFIVGAFNNYPSVAIWHAGGFRSNGLFVAPSVTTLKSQHMLQGLVTTVVQVSMTYDDFPSPNQPTKPPSYFPTFQRDYTFFILLSCVLVGVVLGVSVAVSCYSSSYIKLANSEDGGDEVGGDEIPMTIPLMTLSGGSGGIDFRACFERAMQARHLPTHESLLVINPKEIVLSKIIGEGSFGRVWSGQWRNNAVAVKEFVFAQAAIVGGSIERHNIIEEIVGEAGIMACLRHPKILQLYGCSLTMQAIWIVSELCSRGSLRMVLNDPSVPLTLLDKLSICLDVADGMLYLHTRAPPIIHRDLKSQNIFITEPSSCHYVAKIGDWGSARAVALTGAKSMTHGVGTACWLAPEVINFAHFSKDSDVYAFGIVLWEISTRQEVYQGLSAAQIISKVAHEGLRPAVPKESTVATLMQECWRHGASERPGFHRILSTLSKMYSDEKAKVRREQKNASGNGGSSSSSSASLAVCEGYIIGSGDGVNYGTNSSHSPSAKSSSYSYVQEAALRHTMNVKTREPYSSSSDKSGNVKGSSSNSGFSNFDIDGADRIASFMQRSQLGYHSLGSESTKAYLGIPSQANAPTTGSDVIFHPSGSEQSTGLNRKTETSLSTSLRWDNEPSNQALEHDERLTIEVRKTARSMSEPTDFRLIIDQQQSQQQMRAAPSAPSASLVTTTTNAQQLAVSNEARPSSLASSSPLSLASTPATMALPLEIVRQGSFGKSPTNLPLVNSASAINSTGVTNSVLLQTSSISQIERNASDDLIVFSSVPSPGPDFDFAFGAPSIEADDNEDPEKTKKS